MTTVLISVQLRYDLFRPKALLSYEDYTRFSSPALSAQVLSCPAALMALRIATTEKIDSAGEGDGRPRRVLSREADCGRRRHCTLARDAFTSQRKNSRNRDC